MSIWTIDFFDIVSSRLVNPFIRWMSAYSVLYYLLGYAAFNYQTQNKEGALNGKKSIWMLISAIGICALLQWGYNWLFLDGPLQELNRAKGWITYIVWDNYNALFIVLMTILVCVLFQRIKWKSNRFWMFVGRYSLAIYLLQTPVQRLIEYGLPLRQMASHLHVFGILLPILTLLVSMGITRLMITNKYTRYLIEI